jgi:hypothetical protein
MATGSKALVASALILAASFALHARGNAVTVRLDITGGGLSKPLVVTETALLDLSNVYAGTFLGPVTNPIDPTWQRFVVSFAVGLRTPYPALELTGVQRTYVVHYARDPGTDEGFVYLPGRGEPGHRLNIGLIIREENDGHWHKAAPHWAELLNRHLPRG